MIEAKMCIDCNRLTSVKMIQCSCRGKEFINVLFELEEESNDTIGNDNRDGD